MARNNCLFSFVAQNNGTKIVIFNKSASLLPDGEHAPEQTDQAAGENIRGFPAGNPLCFSAIALAGRLFRFHRIPFVLPFMPAALESVNPGVPHVHQCQCHTGTGRLARSGTIDDKGLFLVKVAGPLFHFCRIDAHRADNLLCCAFPIAVAA